MRNAEPSAPTRDPRSVAFALAFTLTALLVLVVLVRAANLGGEFYDAYELRLEGRRLLAGTASEHPPSYRSPLLILAASAFEALGPTASRLGPALLSAAAYAIVLVCGVLIARRLGARPWVAMTCGGLLLASDHLTFLYGAHGLAYVPAAAAVGLVLLQVLTPRKAPWRQAVLVGLALGLASLLRPNIGLLGLALLAGFPRPWRLQHLTLAALCAIGVYAAVAIGYYALAFGGLGAGLEAQVEVLRFMKLQASEAVARYGGHAPPLAFPRAILASSPGLALLALGGAILTLRRKPGKLRGNRILLAWVALHLLLLMLVLGLFEARFLLPATPALAGLAAVGLEALARRHRRRLAPALAVLLLAGGTLAWTGPYELRRLRDPLVRSSFPAQIAEQAQAIAGPEARYCWTTPYPYPIVPDVVRDERRYAGDPYHAMFHVGPVVLGYHLRQPITMARAPGELGGNLTNAANLRRFVRGAVLPDGQRLRAGDVLLIGLTAPSPTWAVYGRAKPAFGLARVVAGEDGLDVVLYWIPQE